MWATVLAAGCMGVWVALRAAPPAALAQFPAKVMLVPFRGEDLRMARAAAGRPLDLLIDTGDLAADRSTTTEYRLEVVTASGKQIWKSADVSSGLLSVHLPQGLPAGLYWMRLYNRQVKILAKFGLLLE